MDGAQQEGLDGFGLALQDFFQQVVQHKVVAAGEGLDKAGGVRGVPAGRGPPAAARRSSLRCALPGRRCLLPTGSDPSSG